MKPLLLLIYYGWLSSFNYDTNQWSLQLVADDFSQYDVIVFGSGVANPTHGDYANSVQVINSIRSKKASALMFGYVTTNQELSSFTLEVDQWEAMGVDGIFLDESGYDYGKTRSEFNDRLSYIRSTSCNIAFVNAWNPNHVFGTEDDPNFPNSVYNSDTEESLLRAGDWYLLESFSVNTVAYPDDYCNEFDWSYRGNQSIMYNEKYRVNIASVGIIDNDDYEGDDKFTFSYRSALGFDHDAHGISDVSYGSSSSKVKYWYSAEELFNPNEVVGFDKDKNNNYVRRIDKSNKLYINHDNNTSFIAR